MNDNIVYVYIVSIVNLLYNSDLYVLSSFVIDRGNTSFSYVKVNGTDEVRMTYREFNRVCNEAV